MKVTTKKHLNTRKPRNNFIHPRTVGTVLLLLSLVIMLDHAYRQSSSTSVFSKIIVQPVSFMQQTRTSIVDTIAHFTSYFTNRELINELHKELEETKLENIKLTQQLKEHNSYLDAMRFPHNPEFPGIIAIVKLRDSRLTESLIINRGTDDGLTKNRPVYCPDGLVGRIFDISKHFAKVQPINAPGSAVPVYVKGTNYEYILRGTSDDRRMLLTDQHFFGTGDETILPKPGDVLFTSGNGKVFPRELKAGIITSVTGEEGMVCRPAADIQSVNSVIVLKTNALHDEMLSLLVDAE